MTILEYIPRDLEFMDWKIHREKLGDYYKRVLVCEGCKQKFGSDFNKLISFCPVCELKIWRKKREKDED